MVRGQKKKILSSSTSSSSFLLEIFFRSYFHCYNSWLKGQTPRGFEDPRKKNLWQRSREEKKAGRHNYLQFLFKKKKRAISRFDFQFFTP